MKRLSKKVTISKLGAATSQLETAIKLFFEGRDILAAYTLCCAADGILEGLWKTNRATLLSQRGIDPNAPPPNHLSIRELWDDHLVPDHKSEGIILINRTQNFLKHADRDPHDTHTFDPFNETSLRLTFSCKNYLLITEEKNAAISVYMSWFATFYPHLLQEGSEIRNFVESNVKDVLSEADALHVGLELLKRECRQMFAEDQSFIRKQRYSFTLPRS